MAHPVALLIGRFAGHAHAEFLEVSASTLERMTVEWMSQPFRLGICSMALAAYSFSRPELDRAIRPVGVQARVPAAEVVRLERLDWFDGAGGDQIHLLIDAGQLFQRVQQGRGCRTQQRAGLACDNRAVGQFNRSGRPTVGGFDMAWARFDLTLTQGNARLVHEQLELETFRLDNTAGLLVAEALEVPAHDLIQRRFTADIVIDMQLPAMLTPISVGADKGLGLRSAQHCIDDRENLHIAVVVDRRLTVGFQMNGSIMLTSFRSAVAAS